MSSEPSAVFSPAQLFDAGYFVFRSGVICCNEDHTELLVVYNKETGEYRLPRDRCKASEETLRTAKDLQVSRAEDFETTAMRLLREQTGYDCTLINSEGRPTLQPGRRTALACVAPAMVQTEVSNTGVLKITTWYNAVVHENRVSIGNSLGEDWDSKWMEHDDIHRLLCADEVAVLKKSLAVDESDEFAWL
ncbi:MAG: hypothetical protein M1830_009810 [Pleopsidium flavum]|nr:MAG: hypothetical protein M1830_009810 [Pleopsidium flavum]